MNFLSRLFSSARREAGHAPTMAASAEPVPQHIRDRWTTPDAGLAHSFRDTLLEEYYTGWRARDRYSPEAWERDFKAHASVRLEQDRTLVVPWLDQLHRLEGSTILEIGCGTGSSTVALTEQGARVVGLDLDEGALKVAASRCAMHGVQAEFRNLNACEMEEPLRDIRFDFILFFACLEHMLIEERLSALALAWRMLPADSILGIIETPNRLWFSDDHTSLLPFFHWLPDDLAFRYAKRSPRENFRELYAEPSPDAMTHFLRRGRGFSYHEMDLAVAPISDLMVLPSLAEHKQQRGLLLRTSLEREFMDYLHRAAPAIPAAFLEPSLDLAVRKK